MSGEERIGVFLCHCGTNISDTVDLAAVADSVRRLEGVATVCESRFLCADSGRRLIREQVRSGNLTRVVIGACSPLLHEATFRGAVQAAGLNPFALQIANIREQVAWVTPDRRQATEKGAAVVCAAVGRVTLHEPLEVRRLPVRPEALVVGGGIAGIEAALRLAEAGKRVFLVEREPSIGGHVARLGMTFPTLDCSACVVVPRMASVAEHPNITLLANSEVEAVAGHVGAFRVRVRTRARCVDESRCTGCGVCVEACPAGGIPAEADPGLGTRTAIHFPFPQAIPWVPLIDRANCAAFRDASCARCREVCPCGAVDFEQQDTVREIEAGAVILATGFSLFDPARALEYGYGRWDNILTSMQFERLCHPAGPTGGRILMKDGREPERIAILHCVGSRDHRFNRHCSRVCCMTSLKLALLARRRTGARVVNFYVDLRTTGNRGEDFYEQVQRAGVDLLHGRGTEVISCQRELLVKTEDTLLGRQVMVPVDMVVLAVAMEPQPDAARVARLFGIGRGAEGFFAERHLKFSPVQTAVDGVFIAGTCQGPKDIPESIAQGAAAAAGALELIDRGTVDTLPTAAQIDPGRCGGCRVCVDDCPYQAIEIVVDGTRLVARVNEALCKGCGSCAATCPAGAISQPGFTRGQLEAEITALAGRR